MNKKMLKIMSTMLMVVMLVSFAVPVFATGTQQAATGGVASPDQVNPNSGSATSNKIGEVGNDIAGIFRTVGIVLSVIVLMVIGIKYMLGSAEEKSEYKKSLLPYAIGAALVFAASAFAQVIFEFFQNM